MLKSLFPLSFHSIQTSRDARPTNERPVRQPKFSQKALHTGLISSQNGNLLWLTMSQKRLNSISDGATTSQLSTNTFWSIQTIIQNIWRRLSNPIFAMKAKFSLRSDKNFCTIKRVSDVQSAILAPQHIRHYKTGRLSPKRCSAMETVWETERSCPNRLLEPAGMTDYQRRILTKIESLESTDSPIKNTLEDYIDILATGWGSIFRSNHSVYLEVQFGMNNAQCTC